MALSSTLSLASVLVLVLATTAVRAEGGKDGSCVPACMNGGTCTKVDGTDESFCKCKPGYMGADCTAMYQECDKALVCYNGGKCSKGGKGEMSCTCPPKWTGATCKVPVHVCGNNTAMHCMNGGTCMFDDQAREWYCQCPPNIRGRHCQFGVRECKDGMYCMNDGACSDDGTTCVCPSPFFGLHCQNNGRDPNADRIPRSGGLPVWAIALIAVASVVALAAIVVSGLLIYRERRGNPVFKQWQAQEAAGGGTMPAVATI